MTKIPSENPHTQPWIVRLSNELATQLNVPYNSNIRNAIENGKLTEPIAQIAYIKEAQSLRTAATQETVKR
jgi:hypothetical protein